MVESPTVHWGRVALFAKCLAEPIQRQIVLAKAVSAAVRAPRFGSRHTPARNFVRFPNQRALLY